MKTLTLAVFLAALALSATAVSAKTPSPLTVKAEGIEADGIIAPEYAFCIPAPKDHVKGGNDKNVGLSWSAGPTGTKSYAIIAVDPDVPTVFTDAGKEGKTLPASMPRQNFYHWVLFDIPVEMTEIPAGADSRSLSLNGKSDIDTAYGLRGINDYAPYFASNPVRKGVYAGYDGPCPPWNDERVHHYHFKVFALDVATLGLSLHRVTGPEVIHAMEKHILAEGEVVGTYTLNPALRK